MTLTTARHAVRSSSGTTQAPRTGTHRRAFGATAAVVAAVLILSACVTATGGEVATAGGEANPAASEDAENTAPLDADAQALAFAECMRDNGVDMPDPEPGQQGLVGAFQHGAEGMDRATVEQALTACRDLMPQYDHGPDHEQERDEMMLEIAECLRGDGFDVPDNLEGLQHNVDDDELMAALNECRNEIVGGGQ